MHSQSARLDSQAGERSETESEHDSDMTVMLSETGQSGSQAGPGERGQSRSMILT